MKECLDRVIPRLRAAASDPGAPDPATFFQTKADSTYREKVEKDLEIFDPSGRYRKERIRETEEGYFLYLGDPEDPDTPRIQIADEPKAPPPASLAGSGIRGQQIVLDAGHMGSVFDQPWARDEGKYHRFGGAEVSEAKLNLCTTRVVAEMLDKAGAQLTYTRTEGSLQDFPRGTDPLFDIRHVIELLHEERDIDRLIIGYFDDPDSIRRFGENTRKKIRVGALSYYRRFDLARRSCVAITENPASTLAGILERRPQSTYVSIHWNAANVRPGRLSSENGIMAIIPGGIKSDSLDTPDKDLQAASLLLGGNTQDSLALARWLSRSVQGRTGLSAVTAGASGRGWTLQRVWTKRGYRWKPKWYRYDVQDGIFLGWDESMVLREVPGPVVLFEGPYFTNRDEWPQVTKNEYFPAWGPFTDHVCPPRVVPVAQGIFEGLVRFFEGIPFPNGAPQTDDPSGAALQLFRTNQELGTRTN